MYVWFLKVLPPSGTLFYCLYSLIIHRLNIVTEEIMHALYWNWHEASYHSRSFSNCHTSCDVSGTWFFPQNSSGRSSETAESLSTMNTWPATNRSCMLSAVF